MGTPHSHPPPAPPVPQRPRLEARYLLLETAVVLFGIVGVPIGMCRALCGFSAQLVVFVVPSLVGPILVIFDAFLLVESRGPSRRFPVVRRPACRTGSLARWDAPDLLTVAVKRSPSVIKGTLLRLNEKGRFRPGQRLGSSPYPSELVLNRLRLVQPVVDPQVNRNPGSTQTDQGCVRPLHG